MDHGRLYLVRNGIFAGADFDAIAVGFLALTGIFSGHELLRNGVWVG